jgi:hypothetical protein
MPPTRFSRKITLNDVAQAAVIYLYVCGIALGIGMYIYTSPIIDEFTGFHNVHTQGADPMYPISQNLQDSIFLTQLALRDWPIVYFVLLTIAAYSAALRQRSGYA